MMKKILLFASAALCSLTMMAQMTAPTNFKALQTEAKVLKGSAPSVSAVVKAPEKTLGANEYYVGTYSSNTYSSEGLGLTNYSSYFSIGTYIPTSLISAFEGGKVVGMRFAVSQPTNTTHCFILNSSAEKSASWDTLAVYKFDQVVTSKGWTEVRFEKPFTMDSTKVKSIVMGYDYKQTSTNYPIAVAQEGTPCESYLYGNLGSGTGWYNVGLSSYGNLCVQMIIEKQLPANCVKTFSADNVYLKCKESGYAPVLIQNTGSNNVTGLSYTLTVDGVTGEEHSIALTSAIASQDYATVNIPVTAESSNASKKYTLTVTKVNDEANGESAKSVVFTVVSMKKMFTKKVAVEEFTGTGCGYCPRGMAGMEYLRETFGDKFVGIAVHRYNETDPMFCSTYSTIEEYISGAPSAVIDRNNVCDPYYGTSGTTHGVKTDFQEALETVAVAGVTAYAEFTDDTHTKVEATATVESPLDTKLDLEFVVTCDSLYNESLTSWKQSNYYYGDTNLPSDLKQFGYGGDYGQSKFRPYFNDVALVRSYTTAGKSQISTLSLKGGASQEVNFTLTLPTGISSSAKSLTQAYTDAITNMAIVALLVDPSTGVIVNCDKYYFVSPELGIKEVQNNSQQPTTNNRFYNLAGQKVNANTKGIVIINGKKVIR